MNRRVGSLTVLAGLLAFVPAAVSATASPVRLAQAADPVVVQALQDIARYEALADTMAPGDKANGQTWMNELAAVGNRLKAVADKNHPQWRDAAQRFNAVQKPIVEIANRSVAAAPAAPAATPTPAPTPAQSAPPRLVSSDQARLNRATNAIRSLGNDVKVAHFQTFLADGDVAKLRNAAASLRAQLDGLPDAHPDVAAAKEALATVETDIDGRIADARTRAGAVGDIDAQLGEINRRLQSAKVPAPNEFNPDAGAPAVSGYMSTLVALYRQSVADKATLDKLRAAGVKDDRISRLGHWAVEMRQRSVDESYEAARQAMDAHVDRFLKMAGFHAGADPNDRDHRVNRLIGEGKLEAAHANFAAGSAALETAKAFDAAASRSNAPDRVAQARALSDAKSAFEQKYRTALAASRMPPAGMTDAKYLDIARAVLAGADTKISPPLRLVINSQRVQRKEKHEGELRPGTSAVTLTLYHWEWDEYQVATAEKDGDTHYVFYNTLKYFHRGAPTTPTQRWLLAERIKGEKILAENIDK